MLGRDRPPRVAVAAVAVEVARHRHVDPASLAIAQGLVVADLPAVSLPRSVAVPDVLGLVLEARLTRDDRRSRGSYFTPAPVAASVVSFALARTPSLEVARLVCVDPAAGAGSFLLAACRWLRARGVRPVDAVGRQLRGVELDPLAADTANSALTLEVGVTPGGPESPVRVGDGLDVEHLRAEWGEVDLVLGNPPFLGQLSAATIRTATATDDLRERFGEVVQPYTDTAVIFLVAACAMVRPGGRVCMLVPRSILGSRDARAARRRISETARVERLWTVDDAGFDAGVHVCAPLLRVGAGPRSVRVRRFHGVPAVQLDPAPVTERQLARAPSWAALIAGPVPAVRLATRDGVLGQRWTPTAGFRDEYYGLAGLVEEEEAAAGATAGVRLITSGSIDALRCRWGERPSSIHRQRWDRPVVAAAAIDPTSSLGRWARKVLVPKAIVATQTRVVEAIVDPGGHWWPSVPTIVVAGPPTTLWHLAAVLHAPAVSAWAWHRAAGTALAPGAMKLSASDVGAIPLPPPGDAWDAGARAASAAQAASAAGDLPGWREQLSLLGAAMTEAYSSGDAVRAWWEGRLVAVR